MERPSIPAEIKRAVLVEAGHRCAIPRCDQTEIDVHHIVPWSECKKHEYSNLIALCPVCHRRAHKGDIDRKSLFLYKENLATNFRKNDADVFSSPVIEVKRRIYEKSISEPGYTFCFDFPDFQEPVERIVSRNIEAWGNELLVEFRDRQESYMPVDDSNDKEMGFFKVPSELVGDYSIVRRDSKVISVKYKLRRYYTGAAHGGITTRVQNFLIKPFKPITLSTLLINDDSLVALSQLVRERLRELHIYDNDWLERGTNPEEENFVKFNIENYGIEFTFAEYQIGCYAMGEQSVHLSFYDLKGIFDGDLLKVVAQNDL